MAIKYLMQNNVDQVTFYPTGNFYKSSYNYLVWANQITQQNHYYLTEVDLTNVTKAVFTCDVSYGTGGAVADTWFWVDGKYREIVATDVAYNVSVSIQITDEMQGPGKEIGLHAYGNGDSAIGGVQNPTIYLEYPDSYTIIALAGEGISFVYPEKQEINPGYSTTEIAAMVTEGYHWGSWSDGTSVNPYPSFIPTSSVSLTAKAIGNTYYVSYKKNGAYVGKSDSAITGTMLDSTHIYGTAKTLNTNTYSLKGYTFDGWNTKSNGSGVNYANNASVNALTTTANSTINLYAKWKPNTYTIIYNANGGSGSMSNSVHTYDTQKVLNKNTFIKSGYIFIGWSTSASSTKVIYKDEEKVLNLLSVSGDTVTLYAVWIQEGTVQIFVNNAFHTAQVYLYNNNNWHLTQPNIFLIDNWKLNGG